MSEIEDFKNKLSLLEHIKTHVKDNRGLDRDIVARMVNIFPQYIYTGIAYRAINKTWENGHDNLSWSKDIDGAKCAFKSIYSKKHKMNIYQSVVMGFDLDKFISDFQDYMDKYLDNNYSEFEREVLAILWEDIQYIDYEEVKYA